MCEYCVVGDDEDVCTCVCSTYMGKTYCAKCSHEIRAYQVSR